MKTNIKVIIITAALLLTGVAWAQPVTVTDVVGRKVMLKAPAKRVILGEGRSIITLSLLHPDPVSLIAGWTGDFKKSGGLLFDEYQRRFPVMAKIPTIGVSGKETVSTERIISLKPDLAIFGAGSHGPDAKSADVIRQLEAAGIPIIFIDFRLHPFKNTLPSVEILGKVLGREKQAKAYIALYKSHLAKIQERLKGKKTTTPKVYMEMVRGENLVGSPGKGNLSEFIDLVGGHNIGADILPGEVGTLNMEFVIREQPDAFIATGIATPGEPGLEIGYKITEAQAQASLKKLVSRPVVAPLKSVQQKKVYAFWHLFYDSPLNIAAVDALAKWIHPELFKDLDPAATLKSINDKFMAVPLQGTYFAELK